MSVGFNNGETPEGSHLWDFLPDKIPEDEGWDYPWCKLLRMMAAPADTLHSPAGPLEPMLSLPALPWHQGMFPIQFTQHSLEKSCVYPHSWKTSQLPPGLQARDLALCPSSTARPSQAWHCSLAEVCPLRKGHSDLQEVTNLARIRWGPCTRAQALPHLPWVTQSGSESRRGETPGVWRGRGQLLVLSKDLLRMNLAWWPSHCHHHRATAIVTVTMPSPPCHCRHHCATIIIVPVLSSLCHCHCHHDIAVIAMPLLLSSLCYLCQTTTFILTKPPPSSPCRHCHHHATAIVAVPPLPFLESCLPPHLSGKSSPSSLSVP
ncbi:uncharacterized protein LOC119707556 isoform X2 [Motacilla alba alba]|uniref:uncharacterized protein LOC119707556 isoform X1 n=1 Tax=Motacilla alba alba TaxID=1094192 RepID=UPI0018D544DA|nr:uncharacterized protein LOC119707556 isoform X1 [Motacilla alba alba]XP_038008658.1 uncharacterized protein LOC119707556 isoform X2 [Motacilla alba alba]